MSRSTIVWGIIAIVTFFIVGIGFFIVGIGLTSLGVVCIVNQGGIPGFVVLGVFFILAGLVVNSISYKIASLFGYGKPMDLGDLDKKTIYILVGMLRVDTKSHIAVLKNAVGKIICVKTSTYLLAETGFVKVIKLPGGKIELAPAIKTGNTKEE